MKIKLGINDVPFSGYINVDPQPKDSPADCNVIVGDPRNLDGLAQPNEVIEILAPNILNYIHHTQLLQFLQNAIRLLRHGGKLIIGGADLFAIAKLYCRMEISTADMNVLLYGQSPLAWGNNLGGNTLHDVTSILEQMGLRIEKREVSNGQFIVIGVRN